MQSPTISECVPTIQIHSHLGLTQNSETPPQPQMGGFAFYVSFNKPKRRVLNQTGTCAMVKIPSAGHSHASLNQINLVRPWPKMVATKQRTRLEV